MNEQQSPNGDNGDGQRDEGGQFADGNPGGPGRPKGAPNKVNALLKEDIAEAYRQRGGIEWLKALKDRDFVRLLEKTMPRELAADITARQESIVIVQRVINVDKPESLAASIPAPPLALPAPGVLQERNARDGQPL